MSCANPLLPKTFNLICIIFEKILLSAERATDEAEQNSAYYRLIHISPSYWKISCSFEVIPEWELSIGLEFTSKV